MVFKKKVISYILVFGIICSNDSMTDLLKIPLLLSHFAEHNHHNEQISFVDFVAQHYQEEESHHEHEGEDHENLPFHHHDQLTVSLTIASFSEIKQFQFTPLYFENTILRVIHHQEFFPSRCSSSIWRPPKLV